MSYNYEKQHKAIKILVMDVDGTLTDGSVNIGENGELYKKFNIKDGYGITHVLKNKEILPVIITGRTSTILQIRCRELKIQHLYQGIEDKEEFLAQLLEKLGVTYENVAYIGDDLNDLECIKKSALSSCPSDGVEYLKEIVDYVTNSRGGYGAVREFIDWL